MNKKIVVLFIVGIVVAFIVGFFIGDSTAINAVNRKIGSGSGAWVDDNVTVKKEEQKKEEQKKEEKIYKIGDTININDKYELTINKAALTKERNEFCEQKVEKVAVIEYTYKNVNADEDLYVSDLNFKVYDEEGNVLETYPAGVNKRPQEIAKGKKCTAEISYGFNKGNKLELHFCDNMFSSGPDFKILVDAQ